MTWLGAIFRVTYYFRKWEVIRLRKHKFSRIQRRRQFFLETSMTESWLQLNPSMPTLKVVMICIVKVMQLKRFIAFFICEMFWYFQLSNRKIKSEWASFFKCPRSYLKTNIQRKETTQSVEPLAKCTKLLKC